MIKIKIYFGKSVCAAVFFAVFFGYGAELLIAYGAVLFHEGAHLITCIVSGVRPIYIRVSIFGMNLVTEYCTDSDRQTAVYAAGPAASIFAFLFFWVMSAIFDRAQVLFYACTANFCIGLVNLLPVYPLDGANILKIRLCKRFGLIRSDKIVRKISRAACILLLCVSFSVFYSGYFNVSLITIVIFLAYSLKREHICFAYDIKQILCGKLKCRRILKRISADDSKSLLEIAELISPYYTLSVSVFSGGRFSGEFSQREIIVMTKKYGAYTTLKYCIEKREKMLYNKKTECRK